MGTRLGFNLYDPEEADLAWIPYTMLLTRLPEAWEKTLLTKNSEKVLHNLCYLKFGTHPGDKYFKTLAAFNHGKRILLMEYIGMKEKTKYISTFSWLKFKFDNVHDCYFNFMTKEKIEKLPDHVNVNFEKFKQLEK